MASDRAARLQRYTLMRVLAGHKYTVSATVAGLVALAILPASIGFARRAVIAWDVGALLLLLLLGILLVGGTGVDMERKAEDQQEGEWTVFAITLVGVLVSFAALTRVMGLAKDLPDPLDRKLAIALVVATLFLSWLVTHVVFAFRYAHEFYQRTDPAAPAPDRGLDFPGGGDPDYWDFLYFSLTIGMTFQVSDVQISSKKLRRLAMTQGVIGFLFNTVIIALTVNIASSLL